MPVSVSASSRPAAGDAKARTTARLRARLIPLLFLLYVVAYLDRINVGFASLTMNAELSITSTEFGLLAEWGALHRAELMEDWLLARDEAQLKPIAPLA